MPDQTPVTKYDDVTVGELIQRIDDYIEELRARCLSDVDHAIDVAQTSVQDLSDLRSALSTKLYPNWHESVLDGARDLFDESEMQIELINEKVQEMRRVGKARDIIVNFCEDIEQS